MVLLRHKLLVDRDVQCLLLRRTALYAAACTVYFVVILLCSESLSDPEKSLSAALVQCVDEMIYWLPGFAILAPVIAYDILRTTNRFTGPIFRLRREMIRLAEGQDVPPLVFRDEDHWLEMAEIFNAIRAEMIDLRRAREDQPNESSGPPPQERLFDEEGSDAELLAVSDT